MNKKAQALNTGILVGLVSAVVLLAIIAIVMAFGADIVDDVQNDFVTNTAGCNATVTSNCGYAYNISENTLEATNTLASKQNTWALIIGVGVVITLLLGFLGFVALRG